MTDTHDPIDGIKALIAERSECEERIKAINEKLEEIRRSIDPRTTGNVGRKPRLVEKAAAKTAPEPPEAA